MSAAVGAVVVGVGIWIAAHAVAADEFARGLSAYNAADYRTAFDAWYPLADENDPKAQAAIAFLYLKGLGVRQDDVRAADWYRRAAQRGRPEACRRTISSRTCGARSRSPGASPPGWTAGTRRRPG